MYKIIKALYLLFLFNQSFVQSEREIIAISPKEARYIHYEINQPFTRHARELTNEKERFDVNISPFEIFTDLEDDLDPEDVRDLIISTLEANLNEAGSEFHSVQKVAIFGEIIVSLNDGETKIEVDGGKVSFFDIFVNKVSEEELNQAVHTVLENYLYKHDLFHGSSVDVTYPSTVTSPPELDIHGSSEAIIVEEEFDGRNSSGGNSAVAIAFSVIAVVCFVIATAFLVKKKYGNELGNFRCFGRNDNREVASSRLMKRDLDFEEFVVECCSDNIVFDTDENFFSTNEKPQAQFCPESTGKSIV